MECLAVWFVGTVIFVWSVCRIASRADKVIGAKD